MRHSLLQSVRRWMVRLMEWQQLISSSGSTSSTTTTGISQISISTQDGANAALSSDQALEKLF